jgi:L-asparagine transporter-like permease
MDSDYSSDGYSNYYESAPSTAFYQSVGSAGRIGSAGQLSSQLVPSQVRPVFQNVFPTLNPESQMRLEQQGIPAATMLHRKYGPMMGPGMHSELPKAPLHPVCSHNGACAHFTQACQCSQCVQCQCSHSKRGGRESFQVAGFEADDLTIIWIFIVLIVVFMCVMFRQIARLHERLDQRGDEKK